MAKKKKKLPPFDKRFPPRESEALQALAANVRHARNLKNWSQSRLASEASLDQNAISLIENARSNLTVLVLEEIARALDLPLRDLFRPPPPAEDETR